jgi:hypothetical protein
VTDIRGYEEKLAWICSSESWVKRVTAVPPAKSIPGVIGRPVVRILKDRKAMHNKSTTRGPAASCQGGNLAILYWNWNICYIDGTETEIRIWIQGYSPGSFLEQGTEK